MNDIDASITVKVLAGAALTLSSGTISTGALVETLSNGTIIVSGGLVDSGTLLASGLGSLLEIDSSAVVNGAVVVGNGIVDVVSGGSTNVAFLSNASGGLEIADTNNNSRTFTGSVSGFGGVNHANKKQFIDLIEVASNSTISATYTSTGSNGGFLTVTSGAVPATVAVIDFVGHYVTSDFHVTAGISGTVAITDPGVVNGGSAELGPAQAFPQHGIDLPDIAFGAQTMLAYSQNSADTGGTLTVSDGRHAVNIALFGIYMAGSFATAADGHGGTLVTQASRIEQPLLTRPRA